MKPFDSARSLLVALSTVAMLPGCGGPSQAIGTGLTPQGSTPAGHAAQGKSWMMPEARGRSLLYAADDYGGVVYVYDYPLTKFVGELRDLDPYGLCSDKRGNIFVTGRTASISEVLEYAHGGAAPIATLQDANESPAGCAIDPSGGDLAVANVLGNGNSDGDVVVYRGAQGSGTAYSDPDMNQPLWCAYDDAGNLYVEGVNTTDHEVAFAVLQKGSRSIQDFEISGVPDYGGIAWDGKYLVVAGYGLPSEQATDIYQVQVSGLTGTIVNTIQLDGYRIEGGMTIHARDVLMPLGSTVIGRWPYPQGGEEVRVKRGRQKVGRFVTDEAISVVHHS